MNGRFEVACSGGPVLKDVHPYQWLFGELFFVDNEKDQADDTNDQRYKSAPRIPGVRHTSPSDWNEKACRRSDEKDRPKPIHTAQLLSQFRLFEGQPQSQWDEDKSDTNERVVEVEDPSLHLKLVCYNKQQELV